jgi:hypothetical protein
MLTTSVCRILSIIMLCSVAATGVGTAQTAPPSSPNQDGVHVVLLIANAKTASKHQPELPPNVAKALKDASQFLPYTYYELTDQVSLRGAGVNQTIRLSGWDSHEYKLGLSTHPSTASPDLVAVRVSLVEMFGPVSSDVMTTEYSARVGETVVVGTSKVKSDESLVLLLTLLPASAKSPGPVAR